MTEKLLTYTGLIILFIPFAVVWIGISIMVELIEFVRKIKMKGEGI